MWAVEGLWSRHVTRRDLHRRLDALRELFDQAWPPEWDTPEFTERSLQRIVDTVAERRRQGHDAP
ncbi:hypothetical protein ABT354_11040 [Streptomyces sp. NPDC000594]|uniref:hypothetical protein n=1 Tax=Streptomyces sp. NPDC000594 TaxID=3154261 RepID=UPI00331A54AC